MSISLRTGSFEDARVTAGNTLLLRIRAADPSGISRIFIQCFQFSTANTNKAKLAVGELTIPAEDSYSKQEHDVPVHIPENAALGKWGIQMIEFTNGRGHKTAFYRGQGKFDNVAFDVVQPPAKEDSLLQFNGVEIAGRDFRS
jgi:hypothetical protein